jgi:hypothetical protein
VITVIRISNPLQPSVDRETREVPYDAEGNWKLVDYVGNRFEKDYTVSLNGHVWESSLWTEVTPRDGDCIVIAPKVGNSGLLKTLGQLAVAATSIALIATGVGAALGGVLASTFGSLTAATATVVGNAIVGAAVGIGGNLLVSGIASLLSPSQKSQTPSYAFDGPHSLAQSGTVIPKGYGTFMSGGNIIASFVDVEGNDQYINCLVCFGFGPCRNIGQLQIQGKNIETYQNVQYYTRLGTNDQPAIANFNRVVNGYPQQTECLAGVPVVVPGTGDLTQILQVDVQFPGGVFFQTADGNTIAAVVTYQVQYRLSGTLEWLPVIQPLTTSDVVSYDPTTGAPLEPHDWCVVATDLPPNSGVVYMLDNGPHNPGDPWSGSMTVETFQPNGNHSTYNKTFYGEWQRTNPLINQVLVLTWTDGYVDCVNATTQTCYNRTTIYGLAPGKYDVQITKYGSARIHDDVVFGDNFAPNIGQDLWVHSVNEISLLDLAYPNMILVGVRALATSQLSGSDINITAVITYGLRSLDNNLLPAQLQAYEEDNPACVAADMMLDGLYGGGQYPGITTANIDRFIDEWVAWADLNDELVDDGNGGSIRRHVFNGVFDNESDLWNQLGVVGQMSRATIVSIGRDYGVFVDMPRTPVQVFTMGNISADSFTETWMELDARANQVEIQFADSTRYYKQDNPIVYMDPANQDAGVAIKNVRINGNGITIPAQAWHLARYRERCNQFLLRSGSISSDVDAIASRQGNVAILQHDVPKWGWGGRTLPGSTTNSLILDRADLELVSGTAYSVIVLFPALQRYAGLVTAAANVIDVTGANVGVQLSLSAFDGENRVTRAILTPTGGAPVDCPIARDSAGVIVVQPPAGFTPAVGMTYTLWDTDVLETCAVSGVTLANGEQTLTLSTPLPQAPPDYSTYFYGPNGAPKLVALTNIRKQSEFRAKIEWIDYDERVYIDATPTIGETSAVVLTNPGVTSLTGEEIFQLVTGTNVPFISLAWKPGPDTVGVAIYMAIVPPAGLSISNALPQTIARLTNGATSYSMQAPIGQTMVFTVVGFDASDNYAAFSTAPSVTITPAGVTANLLLGSSFQTGFAMWSITPRAGDTFVPSFDDDGQAVYTVAGTTLTAAQQLCVQVVPPASWAIGDPLMLSGYVEDSCTDPTHPNVGDVILTLSFQDASSSVISTAAISAPLSGVAPTLTRFNTAVTDIPTGTVFVSVTVSLGGTGLSLPIGSTVTISHFLLEVAESGQTVPSAWADRDALGNILDIFTTGSSTGLRVQGSLLPSFTGNISFTFTATTATLTWASLVILWPDGAFTYIQDGSIAFTGLSATTKYWAFAFFDIVYGGVHLVTPTTPVGTPAELSAAYDPLADAACKQDSRVALTPGGLSFTTAATGMSGGGGGGNPTPITCTLRGTLLQTPEGPVSNEVLKQRFDAGEPVHLMGREGPEKIVHAVWAPVTHFYRIGVDGFASFGASESLTLHPEGGRHTWCSLLPDGTLVDTTNGFHPMSKVRVDEAGEVLFIELTGPSHEYLVVDGVWTHNFKAPPIPVV